ncbi:MAG: two-component sensor histidine kinase [Deltaproteobacteria bacterium]|nr:two-component sensor histidine kinase [Deltaproteobacteria bacterium]
MRFAKTPVGVDAVKPFALVKYFSFTSFIVIMLGAIILTWILSHRARISILERSEGYALLLAENLNHQVFLQFIVPTVFKFGEISLREEVQYERLDNIVRATIHSFHIDRVTIFDLKASIVYSTDKALVGQENKGGLDYQVALKGRHSSRLVSKGGSMWFDFITVVQEKKLITYIPLRAEKAFYNLTGPILGVFEITQDLSSEYEDVVKNQYLISGVSLGIMIMVFIVLRQIVKRGETIIERRSQERKKLEEQLNQAERLAGLGRMVAGVAHEIRTPLGIIRSTAELLGKKINKYEPNNRLAEVIVEESRRLNNIVTEFLDFARPQTPRLAPCNVENVLDKNLFQLASEMDLRQIILEKKYVGGGVNIMGDPDLLYRAFLNIFNNSVAAMPSGGRINVTTTVKNDNHDSLFEVCITDTGEGIDPDMMKRICDPFFTTKEKGTGLGLSIVKNILDSHAAVIDFQSPVAESSPRGTKVIISFPLADLPGEAGIPKKESI